MYTVQVCHTTETSGNLITKKGPVPTRLIREQFIPDTRCGPKGFGIQPIQEYNLGIAARVACDLFVLDGRKRIVMDSKTSRTVVTIG